MQGGGQLTTGRLPYLRVGSERHRDEVVGLEYRFRAVHRLRTVADAADAGAGLLDEVDAVQQIGDERVSPHRLVAEIGHRHALRQRAGADHLDAVGVKLHEDVGGIGHEPIAVHYRVGDGLAHRLHRVLRDVLAPQTLDAIRQARVALDEAHGFLNVRNDTALEVLAIQNVNLVRAPPKQAGDVRLGEEVAHPLGKEQHAGIAEQQPVAGTLGYFDVHQHVFHRMPSSGDAGEPQPRIELIAVEILRVVEAWAGREVEADHSFGTEEISYLVAAELLRHRALPPKEPVAAMHGLGVALPHLHREHIAHAIRQHLHRWIAVAGNVLNPRPQRVGVLDALHYPIVSYAKQDLAARGVGQRHQLPCEGCRETLLELQRRALALLDEDFHVRCPHRHDSIHLRHFKPSLLRSSEARVVPNGSRGHDLIFEQAST